MADDQNPAPTGSSAATPAAPAPANDDAAKIKEQMAAIQKENARLKAQADAAEKEKLAQQGKFEDLYKKTQAELQEKSQQSEQMQKMLLTSNLNTALATEAAKLGAHDVNAVLKLADTSGIEWDDDLRPKSGDVKAAVEALAKQNPWMFQKSAPQPNTVTPGSSAPPPPKGLNQMKTDEKWQAWLARQKK